MNEVERTVRERFAAYQEWMAQANTTAGTLGREDTVEAFNAFCAGWNARSRREVTIDGNPA